MRNDGLFAAVFLLSRSRPELNRAQASCCCKSLPAGDLETLGPLAMYLRTYHRASDPLHSTCGTSQKKRKPAPDQRLKYSDQLFRLTYLCIDTYIYILLKNDLSLVHTARARPPSTHLTLLQLHLSLRHTLFGFTCRLVSNTSHYSRRLSQPYSWPASTPLPRPLQIRPPLPEPP